MLLTERDYQINEPWFSVQPRRVVAPDTWIRNATQSLKLSSRLILRSVLMRASASHLCLMQAIGVQVSKANRIILPG